MLTMLAGLNKVLFEQSSMTGMHRTLSILTSCHRVVLMSFVVTMTKLRLIDGKCGLQSWHACQKASKLAILELTLVDAPVLHVRLVMRL